ncbi:hypothetical protein AX14_010486 [Amanita brunnescens Koide BX004]|nr:hypothetical protein AX14_010486 [Amanita brunnescens Koide BX004]
MPESSDLVLKLASLLARPLASVEILPGGLNDWLVQGARSDFPFVLTEGNLGVPKKVLYRLYLVAAAMFANGKHGEATSVILLANPAHQTALNARKRLILRDEWPADRELAFTELLLRGSSECAKQSLVWDHRRWIFLRLYETTTPSDKLKVLRGWLGPEEWARLPRIPASIARRELDLTKRACELYPRNYHGWNHWRYIMNVAYVFLEQDTGGEWKELVDSQFREMMKWVEGHVSDYTSMHHLHGLAERFELDKAALVKQASSLKDYYSTHEAVVRYERLVGGK